MKLFGSVALSADELDQLVGSSARSAPVPATSSATRRPDDPPPATADARCAADRAAPLRRRRPGRAPPGARVRGVRRPRRDGSVLWHHGTPGGRRQIPLAGRRAAERLGLRLVCVERPGVGDSTDHRYDSIRDWAEDAAKVVDHLGHDEFVAVGLSGGGPYALACAHELPDRVPSWGSSAASRRWRVPRRHRARASWPWPSGSRGCSTRCDPSSDRALGGDPAGHAPGELGLRLYAKTTPEGDRKVFADPEIKAMFMDDIANASRRRFGAILHDAALFGRPWGFNIADIDAQVFWWHGDADNLVPIAHAEHSAGLLKACEYFVRPTESHLGGFGAVDLVLETLAKAWKGGNA